MIWGGPTASTRPKAVLNNDCVDAVSIGEGEETWLDLANAYAAGTPDLFSIPGLALRGDGGETGFTPERPFLDLAGLPETDWSFVDVEKYFQTSYGCRRMLYLYASKGCPFSCVFCYNKEFHRCTHRKRPLEQLLNEIKYLVTNHRMDGVYFADELWCRSRSEIREICDALRGLDLDFIWGCQTRIGIFDQEDFEYMFCSGCRWMFFGVESGSRRVLLRPYQRGRERCVLYEKSDFRRVQIAAQRYAQGFPSLHMVRCEGVFDHRLFRARLSRDPEKIREPGASGAPRMNTAGSNRFPPRLYG